MDRTGRNQKKEKLNNAGFSMIELIVSVLIVALVALMIGVFVNISALSHRTVLRFDTLETEAQTATDFITEVMLPADECGQASVRDGKCIWIKRPNGKYGLVLWNNQDETLRYEEKDPVYIGESTNLDYQAMVESIYGNEYALLASLVNNISMKIEPAVKGATGQLCTIKMELKYIDSDDDSRAYKTTFKVVNRNAQQK